MDRKSKFDFLNVPDGAKLKVRFLDEAVPKAFFTTVRSDAGSDDSDIVSATMHAFAAMAKVEPTAQEIENQMRDAFPVNLPKPTLRSMLNAVSIKKIAVAIPKRKKKSWMRYTSQKKWVRSFPKRFIYERTPIVMSVSPKLKQKLADLAAQKLGTFT